MLKELFTHPVLLLKSFASLMYITIGILLLAIHLLSDQLGKTGSIALGVLLIAYGIYRLYRVIIEIKDLLENTDP